MKSWAEQQAGTASDRQPRSDVIVVAVYRVGARRLEPDPRRVPTGPASPSVGDMPPGTVTGNVSRHQRAPSSPVERLIGSLPFMSQPMDTNADIWKSNEIAATWAAQAPRREREHGAQWQFMAALLPFGEQEEFTFLDLGAGTGNASRAILSRYPRSAAILADFSHEMMGAGEREMQPYADRYRYVEFDLTASQWPVAIPAALDAVVTSLCVHHLPDERKQGLFAEVLERLVPGGWYVNYDPVRSDDPLVASTWERVADDGDPEAASKRHLRTPAEHARYHNHIRYMIPLEQQLGYLRSAGFQGVDVYWKRLEYVVYAGCRPG
jgi:tRNA (cmo5U34)-methyltransferase